jgi:8-oxo-dGTP pyrophosphatase MutT (NUDIX family)
VLVRSKQANDGVEVFMVRRSASSAFAPDAFVFPGGVVDAQDTSALALDRALGIDAASLREDFRTESAAGLLNAALRELFEEAGVLFAAGVDGDPLDHRIIAARSSDLERARVRVRSGEDEFVAALATYGWRPDARGLALFSHWITPPTEPRRYDTHFFVAHAPEQQSPIADAGETHDGRWIEARAALEEYRAGRMHLVYPTIKHLERLENFTTPDELMTFARSKPIVTIVPNVSAEHGFVMPESLEQRW